MNIIKKFFAPRTPPSGQNNPTTPEPTALLAFLAQQTIAPAIRKAPSGDEYVLFGEYMARSSFLHEIGAILGLHFRNQITIFAQLFCGEGRESELITTMQDDVAKKMNNFKEDANDLSSPLLATRGDQANRPSTANWPHRRA